MLNSYVHSLRVKLFTNKNIIINYFIYQLLVGFEL